MKRKTDVKHYLWQLLAVMAIMVSGTAFAGLSGQADLRSTKLDLGVKQGTILEIMDKISGSTDYVFIYEDGIKSQLNKKVTIENGKNLQEVLSDITRQSKLEFRAINNNIVVRERSADQSSVSETTFQAIRVSGKVTSAEDNTGLPGVNIVQKGTVNGTVSDIDGNYSLDVPTADAVLVFSSVGFLSEEIPVGGRSIIDLAMSPDITSLNEVVVTALGIKREERSLGYSVGALKGEELSKVSNANVLTSLAGKMAGVQINSISANATSSVSMVIRGIRSLNNDNQPLFVIDGVPVNNTLNNVTQIGSDNKVDYGNAISDLNANDIENISVLKGPSAAALYGSRAGNGVVLITTKSGKKSQGLGVSVSSNTIFEKGYKSIDSHSLFAIGNRPFTEPYGGNDALEIPEGDSYWVGSPLDKGIRAIQWNSPLDENGDPIPTELVSHKNNWKNFVQTGVTTDNNVAVSNETDKVSYRVSYSNFTNRGLIPNSDLFRNNLNLSSALKVTKDFVISTNINIGRSQSDNVPSGNRGTNPLQSMVDVSPHIDIRDLQDYWMPGQEGIQQRSTAIGDYNNPYFLAYEVNNSFMRDRVFGNLMAEWTIIPELKVHARYSQDQFNEQRETKIAKSYTGDKNGVYGIFDMFTTERNLDFLASYNKRFNELSVSASAGANSLYSYTSSSTVKTKDRGTGLVVPGLFRLSNILPTALDYSNGVAERAIYSVYGTASLGYKDMIYLDLTARNDWSSTLPEENRSYFYPSASLSLLINEMLGFNDNISLLKLRGGWAQVGKDTAPYSLYSVLGNVGAWNNVVRLTTSDRLLNPTLMPEIATSWEVGVDVGLWSNRLRFEGTIYQSDNENQILPIKIPQSSGYTNKMINAGLIRSEGIELALSGTPVSKGDWRWDIGINWSKNKSTIMELAEGLAYFQFWSDAKGGAWTYAKGAEIPATGEISTGVIGQIWDRAVTTVTDKSSPYYGWPILDEDGSWNDNGGDLKSAVQIGNFNPDFLMGMQTSISYKAFTLSASFDWRQGGDFVSQTYRYGESDFHMNRQLENTIKFDGPMEDLPAFLKSNPEKYIIISDEFHTVGGPTEELGGLEFTDEGVTLHDGVFNPGVIEEFDDEGNFIGYIENLGGPGTKLIPYSDNYPWSFTKAAMFDASFIKLREINLSAQLPKSWIEGLHIQNASFGVFSRNIMLWTAAKIGVDPEMAYQPEAGVQNGGIQFKQGIERYNVMPWTIPVGFKLNFTF